MKTKVLAYLLVVTMCSGGGSAWAGTEGLLDTFFGYAAGGSIATGTGETFIGMAAGNHTNSGSWNTFVGHASGYFNTTGHSNSFFGYFTGYNATGNENSFLGYYAGYNTTGSYNTFLGSYSGQNSTVGGNNTFVGYGAGNNNTTGGTNTSLGNLAGYFNNGSGNIFVGNRAGFNETGSNRLYIDNSNTSTPLIYGEFDNRSVRINGAGNGVPGYPAYTLDVSNLGVTRLALHFSLDGTDTGGWITSVADNNFWLSSGAMWDTTAGGWVQKSPDTLAVMAGLGSCGLPGDDEERVCGGHGLSSYDEAEDRLQWLCGAWNCPCLSAASGRGGILGWGPLD